MTLSGYLCLMETACGCRKWLRIPRPVPELRLPILYPIGVAAMIDGPGVSDRAPTGARRFINLGYRAKGSRRYFHFREIK